MLPSSWASFCLVEADASHLPASARSGGLLLHRITKVRGSHPLVATVAGWGDVLHTRLRGGPAFSGRSANSFIRETVTRVRMAGATGTITLRADPGFCSRKVVEVCQQLGVRFSITVRLNAALPNAIAAISDGDWVSIPYWLDGAADVAETTYRAFGKKKAVRLIVRRVEPTPGSQLALKGVSYTTDQAHRLLGAG